MIFWGMVAFPLATTAVVAAIGLVLKIEAAWFIAFAAGAIVFGLGTLFAVTLIGLNLLVRVGPFVIPMAIAGSFVGANMNNSAFLGAAVGAIAGVVVFLIHSGSRRFNAPRSATYALDALVVAAFLGAAFIFGPAVTARALDGTVTIPADTSSGIGSGQPCQATGRNGDFVPGYPVTFKDNAGVVFATTRLSAATMDGSRRCVFGFQVKPLPFAYQPWTIDLGVHGSIQVTSQDFSPNGLLELKLGTV
jgi:hypothetical protein